MTPLDLLPLVPLAVGALLVWARATRRIVTRAELDELRGGQ